MERGTDAPLSPPRWQEAEVIVCRVAGVAHNHSRFPGEAGTVCM